MLRKLFLCLSLTTIACGTVITTGADALIQPEVGFALGTVYHDQNRNGKRDPGEPGLRNIRVSNGREITRTDRSGRWRLPVDDDTTFFVIKPRGWMTPVNEHQLPRFYYTHKPKGSPPLRFPGVEPTGPLPASIDFPLHPQKEPNRFQSVFFGDPQPRDEKEVEYIAHDVVEELIGTDAAFGVTLGDITFDDLSLFPKINGTVALIGIPWYNVIGNHDINYDAPNDKLSDETFERYFGPSYYSFDYGPVHFIVLDDIMWSGSTPQQRGKYTGGLGPDQIEFIKNDLQLTPRNQLVVLMMHIPLTDVEDRKELYDLLSQRPYTMSISGHTHYQEHRFITREDGWTGPEPHHHIVNVTVSGSWWSGAPDERGIPHTLMADGAPNGYSLITFDGHNFTFDYKVAGRSKDYQMNIYAPEKIRAAEAGNTDVLVNVFAGSDRSKVEMRLGDGNSWTSWATLTQTRTEDPAFVQIKQQEAGPNPPPGRKLPGARKTPHMWEGKLPTPLKPGLQRIEVRHTDMWGRHTFGNRIIHIQ